jgi:hypothetical protein
MPGHATAQRRDIARFRLRRWRGLGARGLRWLDLRCGLGADHFNIFPGSHLLQLASK